MKFEKRVKQIKNAEKDVDKVLKAAKLQRIPKEKKGMDDYVFALILAGMVFVFFIILIIGGAL